jgi:enoyl reductase
MQLMKVLLPVVVAGSLLFAGGAAPPTAPPRGVESEGFQDGNTRKLVLRHSKIRITGDGAKGGKSDGYELKSPCWYEPGLDAEKMLEFMSDARANASRIQRDEEGFNAFIKQFKDKVGQPGLWWTPAYDAGDPKGAACWAGLELFVFVPPDTTPPSGITFQELAEVARAALTVPEGTIKLNPDAKSYVNLPTFVWLEDIGQPRRTVTATLPGVMSATVVATLSDIRIKAGTDRAEVVEKGCGPSGKPYTKGAEFSCGVRYERASIDQPRKVYELTVTSVWPVEVTGGAQNVQFDPVQAEVTRDVPVGEVQSNVKP